MSRLPLCVSMFSFRYLTEGGGKKLKINYFFMDYKRTNMVLFDRLDVSCNLLYWFRNNILIDDTIILSKTMVSYIRNEGRESETGR